MLSKVLIPNGLSTKVFKKKELWLFALEPGRKAPVMIVRQRQQLTCRVSGDFLVLFSQQ
jgi:hypothetical protein